MKQVAQPRIKDGQERQRSRGSRSAEEENYSKTLPLLTISPIFNAQFSMPNAQCPQLIYDT
ncbi:hypothetical protein H6G41_06785 [Tolypothrix sp. FACHB-123]|uniref:hypothetical protein n=1 Tax=Tolypothrix sp. FACHB-123 TaxID=2692868 RepID=UPI0016889CBA|nr:hypothetical protein [Tolypothrix sp. FACHB-123]MBD2354334.1 hypothetical protein [Tolypothrix sp. FACHB-123]